MEVKLSGKLEKSTYRRSQHFFFFSSILSGILSLSLCRQDTIGKQPFGATSVSRTYCRSTLVAVVVAHIHGPYFPCSTCRVDHCHKSFLLPKKSKDHSFSKEIIQRLLLLLEKILKATLSFKDFLLREAFKSRFFSLRNSSQSLSLLRKVLRTVSSLLKTAERYFHYLATS